MIAVILISAIISFAVSYAMMKFHLKMTNKWMDRFFEEETKRMGKMIDLKTSLKADMQKMVDAEKRVEKILQEWRNQNESKKETNYR